MSLKTYGLVIRNQLKMEKRLKSQNSELNTIAANLIKNIHSIEKGLCIENPRLGFGHSKQKLMLERIKKLENVDSNYYKEIIEMAISSLNNYIDYMDKHSYTDDFIEEMKKELEKYPNYKKETGGVQLIKKADLKFNEKDIEYFIKSRHSIRDFADTEIDNEKLKKALTLAQYAPSACNRQAYRVYVLNQEQQKVFSKWLEGVGGFANKIKKLVLITGKISSYNSESELNQYIVSPSIYVGYLSLTLHLYGFGACIIQRPVTYSNKWEQYRQMFNIPEDELLICAVAVGNLKDNFYVPISHRFSEEDIIKFL